MHIPSECMWHQIAPRVICHKVLEVIIDESTLAHFGVYAFWGWARYGVICVQKVDAVGVICSKGLRFNLFTGPSSTNTLWSRLGPKCAPGSYSVGQIWGLTTASWDPRSLLPCGILSSYSITMCSCYNLFIYLLNNYFPNTPPMRSEPWSPLKAWCRHEAEIQL